MFELLVTIAITFGFMGVLGGAFWAFEWGRFIIATHMDERKNRKSAVNDSI